MQKLCKEYVPNIREFEALGYKLDPFFNRITVFDGRQCLHFIRWEDNVKSDITITWYDDDINEPVEYYKLICPIGSEFSSKCSFDYSEEKAVLKVVNTIKQKLEDRMERERNSMFKQVEVSVKGINFTCCNFVEFEARYNNHLLNCALKKNQKALKFLKTVDFESYEMESLGYNELNKCTSYIFANYKNKSGINVMLLVKGKYAKSDIRF